MAINRVSLSKKPSRRSRKQKKKSLPLGQLLMLLMLVICIVLGGIYITNPTSFVFKAFSPTGNVWFVAPEGTATGNGSINQPWDIVTAFNGPASVRPGDTVYLRGGVYGNGGNICGDNYKINIGGSSDNYLTIGSYPGELATINEAVVINGSWLIVRDLNVTNTDTNRYTSLTGSNHCSGYTRGTGISVLTTTNVRLINNFVNNAGNGISGDEPAVGLEVYGNLIQNNGWGAPDRPHGHGIYVQNRGSTFKKVNNNIVMPGIDDTGMHLYGSDALVDSISMENNIHYTKRWLIQTEGLSSNVSMKNNYLWNSYLMAGYISNDGYGLQVDSNYFGGDGGATPLQILILKANLNKFNIVDNTFCFTGTDYFMMDEGGYTSDDSHYFDRNIICSKNKVLSKKTSTISYDSWKSNSGFNKNEISKSASTIANKVVVIPNIYEEKRGHIAIYNWENLNTVKVDISSLGYKNGDTYRIYNALNYFGDSPITGNYNGTPVSIDMRSNRWTLAEPNGGYPSGSYNPGNSYPKFGAFVVRSSGTAIEVAPTPSTPTPKPTPLSTPVVTPVVTPKPTPLPTVVVTPRPTSTATPKLTPLPTAVVTPKPVPTSIPKPSSNLIMNGNFDNGTGGWNFYAQKKSADFIVYNNGENQYAEIKVSARSNNIQLYQYNIPLESNSQYRLKFSIRSTPNRRVLVVVHKHGFPYLNYGLTEKVSMTGEWQNYSFEFTPKFWGKSVDDARLRFYFSPYERVGDKYFIDNVELIKL